MNSVFFVSNRDPDRPDEPRVFGSGFSAQDVHDLRFGRVDFKGRGKHRKVESLAVAPENLDPEAGPIQLGSDALFLDLTQRMQAGEDTLLFVHGYWNSEDTALVASDWVKDNDARLGSRGPRLPHGVPGNVTLVDCSDVVSGGLEHSYFCEDSVVIRDLVSVFRGTDPDRIVRREYRASQNRYVLKKSARRKKE